MSRRGVGLVLALLIGFALYRVVLATFAPPAEQRSVSSWQLGVSLTPIAVPVEFDEVTGFPNSPDHFYLYPLDGLNEARAHWLRSVLVGMIAAILLVAVTWWFGRRRPRQRAMRGVATTVALALSVLGCGTPVNLLTGGADGCSIRAGAPTSIQGTLVAHPESGIAIDVDRSQIQWPDWAGRTVPVRWPPGFTGRGLSSGEIEVVNTDGAVVATTGRHVALELQWTATSRREFEACSAPAREVPTNP